ncbi:MAG: hypothetical protein C4567_14160 [Deltaproteobacteria bacterium]|nr:MAG: hypothetical protein C4567_14160 [Deltaproteobacteria bacterium]
MQTHTAFLQAVTKRLDYLQTYTTLGHYRDNINLLRLFSAWQDLLLIEITPEIIRKKLIEIRRRRAIRMPINVCAPYGLSLNRHSTMGILVATPVGASKCFRRSIQ